MERGTVLHGFTERRVDSCLPATPTRPSPAETASKESGDAMPIVWQDAFS